MNPRALAATAVAALMAGAYVVAPSNAQPITTELPPAAFNLAEPTPAPMPGRQARTSSTRKPGCSDPLARALARAGWTGPENRVAWAIVMRESNGQPHKVGGPNGQDRGLWQLNRPAWGKAPWWDEEKLLDATYNIHAARIVWEEYGARPWGLTEDGDLDTRDYQRWTPEERDRWIMAPWREWFDKYPCKVAP